MHAGQITDRLRSAELRLGELEQPKYLGDAGPRLPEAEDAVRLRLAQEFFFHLCGSIDVLGQLINDQRELGFAPEKVWMGELYKRLLADDPLRKAIEPLGQTTRDTPMPKDPYNDEGLVYRALLYRNSTTHRHVSPFVFRITPGTESTVHLLIDARAPGSKMSDQTADEELKQMLAVVRGRCEAALAAM